MTFACFTIILQASLLITLLTYMIVLNSMEHKHDPWNVVLYVCLIIVVSIGSYLAYQDEEHNRPEQENLVWRCENITEQQILDSGYHKTNYSYQELAEHNTLDCIEYYGSWYCDGEE